MKTTSNTKTIMGGQMEISPKFYKPLLKFMLSEEILTKFLHNYEKEHKNESHGQRTHMKFYTLYDISQFFNTTLFWANTQEGGPFWGKIHRRWEKYIETHKRQIKLKSKIKALEKNQK